MKVEQGLSWAVVLGVREHLSYLTCLLLLRKKDAPLKWAVWCPLRGAWAPSALALKNQLGGRQSK